MIEADKILFSGSELNKAVVNFKNNTPGLTINRTSVTSGLNLCVFNNAIINAPQNSKLTFNFNSPVYLLDTSLTVKDSFVDVEMKNIKHLATHIECAYLENSFHIDCLDSVTIELINVLSVINSFNFKNTTYVEKVLFNFNTSATNWTTQIKKSFNMVNIKEFEIKISGSIYPIFDNSTFKDSKINLIKIDLNTGYLSADEIKTMLSSLGNATKTNNAIPDFYEIFINKNTTKDYDEIVHPLKDLLFTEKIIVNLY